MGRRKDGMPRSLPPYEPSTTCYYADGVCPFHGVQHQFTPDQLHQLSDKGGNDT